MRKTRKTLVNTGYKRGIVCNSNGIT